MGEDTRPYSLYQTLDETVIYRQLELLAKLTGDTVREVRAREKSSATQRTFDGLFSKLAAPIPSAFKARSADLIEKLQKDLLDASESITATVSEGKTPENADLVKALGRPSIAALASWLRTVKSTRPEAPKFVVGAPLALTATLLDRALTSTIAGGIAEKRGETLLADTRAAADFWIATYEGATVEARNRCDAWAAVKDRLQSAPEKGDPEALKKLEREMLDAAWLQGIRPAVAQAKAKGVPQATELLEVLDSLKKLRDDPAFAKLPDSVKFSTLKRVEDRFEVTDGLVPNMVSVQASWGLFIRLEDKTRQAIDVLRVGLKEHGTELGEFAPVVGDMLAQVPQIVRSKFEVRDQAGGRAPGAVKPPRMPAKK